MYIWTEQQKEEAFRILVIAWDAFAKEGLAASFVNIEVDTETRSWFINFTKHFKVIYKITVEFLNFANFMEQMYFDV